MGDIATNEAREADKVEGKQKQVDECLKQLEERGIICKKKSLYNNSLNYHLCKNTLCRSCPLSSANEVKPQELECSHIASDFITLTSSNVIIYLLLLCVPPFNGVAITELN